MVEADYRTLLEGKFKEFKELSTFKDNDWKLDESTAKLSVYKRSVKGFPTVMVGCSTRVKAQADKILGVLLNDAHMLELEDALTDRKIFKTEKGDAGVTYYFLYQRREGKLVVDPRDMVIAGMTIEEGGSLYYIATSYEDKDHPPVKGSVRASCIIQGWKFTQNGDDLDASLIMHMDPKGSVPSTIVNSRMKSATELIFKIVEFIEKKKL